MKRNPWIKLFAVLGVGLCLAASAWAGELYNCYTNVSSSEEFSFTLLLKGDVTSYINTSATEKDPGVDPFAYVNKNYFNGNGTSTVTTSLIGGNTEVVFTGSNPILQSYHFMYGGQSNKEPHFGLLPESSGSTKLDVLSQQWNSESPFSAISVDQTSGNGKYQVIFAVSNDGSHQTGAWYEVPYNSKFTFTNNGNNKLTLENVGYFISNTQIPLDNLNFGDTPPPGLIGSQFSPLPQYDGMTVGAGQSINVNTPEPGTLMTFGSCALALAAVLRRRI